MSILVDGTSVCVVLHEKLDGVGPVDNRPSTDKLHHSVLFFLQDFFFILFFFNH